ncbi:MAG: glucose dehydrogenase [Naasia sp.]|jgi:glucose/arabinose dehydrogenase|uniref:PQQ-dependent sugar dehydrogenase n=1 Tax=Naasia sp. TaxID=2546198 RepID=UPI00262FE3C1|nr:PQQ-dependent sugar dehydrogenase [Naasia sp.]MCU1570067.1 glucose dehydrogenase [Naasia sp.]
MRDAQCERRGRREPREPRQGRQGAGGFVVFPRVSATAGLTAAALVLAGCVPQDAGGGATPVPLPSPPPGASSTPSGTPLEDALQPAGTPEDVVTGLEAPWSVLPIGDTGSTLISQRDAGTIVELDSTGQLREVTAVTGSVHEGEGGLLGLALLQGGALLDGTADWVYAYYTSATDNRVVRMPLSGDPGALELGDQEEILTGLKKAGNHDGGRIAFGPDGMLYATVGDAGDPDAPQDPASLNGKILRMTPEGDVPDGNPLGDSLVWSLGHRNPQGLAWASDGTMWAAEFGQDTWDELNRIEPGNNYGWPVVEGEAHDARFVDPVRQWSTDEASPSGLAAVGGTLFLAGLGGRRLWVIQDDGAEATAYFSDEYGRIRDVLAAPDGSLWFLTNNTDGRGSPRDGDDRLVRIPLAPA